MNRAEKIKIIFNEIIEDFEGILNYNELKNNISKMSNEELDKELEQILD